MSEGDRYVAGFKAGVEAVRTEVVNRMMLAITNEREYAAKADAAQDDHDKRVYKSASAMFGEQARALAPAIDAINAATARLVAPTSTPT